MPGGVEGGQARDRGASLGNELSAWNVLHDCTSRAVGTKSSALYRSKLDMYRAS